MSGRGNIRLGQYDRSRDASPQARQARNFANKDRPPYLPVLGWHGGCWCGEPMSHEWPGKADGAPHPRRQSR